MNVPKNYSLLIFDWDGTLADSGAKIVNCFMRSAKATGVAPPDPGQVRACIGLGLQETFGRLYPGLGTTVISALIEQYRICYFQDPITVHPFPGVIDGLARLQQHGYWLAVATGKSHEGLVRGMQDFDISGRFVYTRCADQSRPKPDPLMLFDILEATGKPAEAALMIGDTTYDMEMAAQAGVDGWGVGYGSHSSEQLHPFSCMDVAENFTRIVDVLAGAS